MPERRRVLVVEDDEVVRLMLVEALTFEGYEVRAAPEGAAGLLALEGWSPDLILLDLMMPGMDGWRFREEQRARPALRDVPVVIVSASRDLARAADVLHPAAVVAKPFDLGDVIATVQRCARAPSDR